MYFLAYSEQIGYIQNMDFLKSIEFASISDAIKTGVIDHHKLYDWHIERERVFFDFV